MINLDDIIIGRKSQYLSFPSYDMGFLQALKTYSENSRQIVPVWDHLTAPALEIHSSFMAFEAHNSSGPTAYQVWPAWLQRLSHHRQQVVEGTQLAQPQGRQDPPWLL